MSVHIEICIKMQFNKMASSNGHRTMNEHVVFLLRAVQDYFEISC